MFPHSAFHRPIRRSFYVSSSSRQPLIHTISRSSYSRIDPAQEIARLRHSISLLEAYVFPTQRNQPPPHRRPSDASSLVPKKEVIDPDVTDKPIVAPGMLGSQGQGGLYTGATSTTTHLLMVIHPPLAPKTLFLTCCGLERTTRRGIGQPSAEPGAARGIPCDDSGIRSGPSRNASPDRGDRRSNRFLL